MRAARAGRRLVPWLEGAALAAVVLAVLSLGGDTVRTSYHGYLHASIGEAVLREGLLPENPYHAGAPLRYYLLYPLLGVATGHLGFGPLWAFALLNGLAALLFAPALDALGRATGLDFRARRWVFLFAVVGFNAVGGLWAWSQGILGPDAPNLPLLSLRDLSLQGTALAWDGRLQSFLPKFLNVSSFALSLPFALWALAWGQRHDARTLLRAGAALGLATAINPLAGGWTALLVAAAQAPRLLAGGRAAGARLAAAALAAGIALPFLLPLLVPAPEAAAPLEGRYPFPGHGALANLIGPNAMVLAVSAFGWRLLAPAMRLRCAAALALAAAFCFTDLPWDNQYKFARMAGILVALPAGAAAARAARKPAGAALLGALVVVALPTTLWTLRAYLKWDASGRLPLTAVRAGRLVPNEEVAARGFPRALQEREAALPAGAVWLMHPRGHPGASAGSIAAQGNAFAPVLHRPLFVDQPQIHNLAAPDLRERLHAAFAVWQGTAYPLQPGARPPAYPRARALQAVRAALPGRALAILSLDAHEPSRALFAQSGAERLAEENGVSLWWLPPLREAGGN